MLSGEMDTIDVIEVQLENNNTVVLTESDRNIANFLPALLSVPVLLRDEESQQFWSSAEDNVHVLLSICRIFEKKTRQILQELQAKKATTSDKNAVLHLLCQCGGLRLKLNASSENNPIDGGNVTCIKTEQSWNQVDPDPTPMEEPPPDDKHWIASDASGIIHEAAEKTTEPEECNQESLISVNVQDDGIVNFTRLENSNEVPSTSTGQTYILKKTKPFETVKFPFKRKLQLTASDECSDVQNGVGEKSDILFADQGHAQLSADGSSECNLQTLHHMENVVHVSETDNESEECLLTLFPIPNMSALKAQENAKKMKLTQKVIGKRNGKCRTGKARCTKSNTSKVQHTFCDDCDTDDCCDDDDDGDDDDHQDVANNSCEEPDYDPCEEIEEMSESANSDEENSASNCVTQRSKRFKVDKTFPSKCRDRQKSVRRGQIDSGEENRNTTENSDDLKGLKSPSMSSSSKMWVQPTSTDSKGKRKWDKYHYCVYCEKKYAKLPRHFQQKHKEEIKVCQAFSFPKGSKQRRLHLKRLMNRGNHAHNCKVLEKGSGNIVVRKRPTYEAAVYDYLPCTHCLAYFVRGDVSKHEKVCPFRPVKDEEGSASKSYRRLQGKSALLLPVGKDASIGLRENVLARMNVDAVSMVVRGDRLIKQFGENLYKKQGLGSDFQYVSQQMRELGRLVIAMREVTNDDELTLTHCIDPQMFDKVIKGVQNVSGYDEMNSAYKVPSLVMKLGKSLRKCGMICKGNAIKTEDQHLENKAQRFLQLADVQWAEEISSNALKTISERKRNKTTYLQLVSDMAKLHKHMKRTASESAKQLKADPNEKAWAELCRVTLAQMILFNRRRSSEMSRMTMDDYENIHRGINEGVDSCLSSFEDHLCQKMNVVEVRGKRGRNVPVILTSCVKDQVDLLVSSRNKVGINQKNKYVFACLKNSELPVHGSIAIRKYADSAGLLAPEVVTSTGLRKQIATLSQVFNLTEHEMDIIAGFIGHNIRIHKLPNHTLQVSKLGRILMAFEEGNITQFKGKTLDEIEVDSYELSEEEEEADDKEENVDGLHTVEAGKTDDVTVDDMDISDDHGNLEGNKKDAAVTHNEEDTKRKKKWTKWTVEEHETVMKHFQKEVRLLKLPGKTDCETCKKKYPVLFAKSWSDIKYHVYNKIKQRKAKV